MLSQQTITQILQADIGDVIDLDGGKGKLVEREPMRDSRGFETFALLIQPEGGKKAEQPKEFTLQSGAVNSSLCVVAGLLYSSGDRGLLLRWNAEYTMESGDKKIEGGLFFLHGTALEEDETTLSHWVGNGGAVLPDKMTTAMKKQLRDYLVKAQPALKAVSIEDLRERCARNGWEITVPGSKG